MTGPCQNLKKKKSNYLYYIIQALIMVMMMMMMRFLSLLLNLKAHIFRQKISSLSLSSFLLFILLSPFSIYFLNVKLKNKNYNKFFFCAYIVAARSLVSNFVVTKRERERKFLGSSLNSKIWTTYTLVLNYFPTFRKTK